MPAFRCWTILAKSSAESVTSFVRSDRRVVNAISIAVFDEVQSVVFTVARCAQTQAAEDRVALGDCSPRAPTDPYVRALPHTVPRIMGSLHDEAGSALREREQAGSGVAERRISPSASSGCCCGD